MSSRPRSARKAANPRAKAPEPIITRTKSAQQRRQLRNKEAKKTEKPELTKQETKSTKVIKTAKRPQESLLKLPVVVDSDELSQVEYYPNTLKRNVPAKKIMLKPKHNFKVIATTNKRKLATPQKGIKSPTSKHTIPPKSKSPRGSRISTRPTSSPELSVQDMVRMMEETRSLSDEDFMEILTCPSPVWWEDPPDGVDEDSIKTKSLKRPPLKNNFENKKRKITPSTPSRNPELEIITIKHPKGKDSKTDEGFIKKKQKLENILGNIKNKTVQTKNEVSNIDKPTNRKLSESEGDFLDLSFNEEEILKNLEDMDIPIEQSHTESNDSSEDVKSEIDDIDIKEEAIVKHSNEIAPKNENLDREILSIEIKKEIKDDFLIRSPVFCKDSIPNTSLEISSIKKSDDVLILDRRTNSSLGNTNDSSSIIDLDSINSNFIMRKSLKENFSNETVPNKKTKDLCEFITVYKITPDLLKNESNSDKSRPENINTTKLETVRGKLNDFFKHCKSNVRLKKIENTVPAIPLTDVK